MWPLPTCAFCHALLKKGHSCVQIYAVYAPSCVGYALENYLCVHMLVNLFLSLRK